MELETIAGATSAQHLTIDVRETASGFVFDPVPMLAALGEQRQRGIDVSVLAACFHESVAHAAAKIAMIAADHGGVDTVALGGGSFQNARLLCGVRARLEQRGLRVLLPRQLGPNDGAISFGQAAIAASLLAREN